MPKTAAVRIAVAFTVLLAAVWTAGLVGVAAYVHHAVAHVAHTSDLGNPNVAKIAEAYVAQAAQSQGYVVQADNAVSVKTHGDAATVKVRVRLLTPDGSSQTVTVTVTLAKGVWQATGFTA